MQNTFMYAYREKGFDTNWLYRHWIRLIEYSGARFLFFPRFAAAFFSTDLKSSQRRNKKSSGRLYCVIVTLLFPSCKRSLLSLSLPKFASILVVWPSVVWREKEFGGRQVRTGQTFSIWQPFLLLF